MERDYTHPSVLAGIAAGAHWADPAMNPAEIYWEPRQSAALIPFRVVNGRPVNPFGPTGIRYGRNEFGHWGEQAMADALVTVTLGDTRYLLMVERADGHGWAVPGGYAESGETGLHAAVRELAEETGYTGVRPSECTPMPPRHVPDPRSSDEAWAVTVPVRVSQGMRYALPEVSGGDDARRAEWVAASSFGMLTAELAHRFQGRVFAAHVDMLREFLG